MYYNLAIGIALFITTCLATGVACIAIGMDTSVALCTTTIWLLV